MKFLQLLIAVLFVIILIFLILYRSKNNGVGSHPVESKRVSNASWVTNQSRTLISYMINIYHVDDEVDSIFIKGNGIVHQVSGPKKKPEYQDGIIVHGVWLIPKPQNPDLNDLYIEVKFKSHGVLTLPFDERK